jgi:hypothetical protein
MYTLIWIIFVLFILILVAISEYNIAKQDREWLKELRNDGIWKKEEKIWKEK